MDDPGSTPHPLPATPEALAKVLERRPVLWAGAGLSIGAGYPSAAELVERMARAADDPLDTSQPFFAIADAFVASMGKGHLAELMQRSFIHTRAPTAAHRALARLAGAGRFHAMVTTNFDSLLERALDQEEVPYLVQPFDDTAPITGEGEIRILKLEGSYEDWLRIVVSGRAHADFSRRYAFLEEQLQILLRQRPVLFIGSALKDERLLDWIAALSDEDADALKPWRAVIARGAWDEVLGYRYERGNAEHAAAHAIHRAHLRPLLLDSHAELPGLLTEVADLVAPRAAIGSRMMLRELRLREFRGFGEFHLVLPDDPIAVVVGVNGAGKSSVVDGIAMLLAKFAGAVTQRATLGAHPVERDIRDGAQTATLGAIVTISGEEQRWELTIDRPDDHALPPQSEEGVRATVGPTVGIRGIQFLGVWERLTKDRRAGVPVVCRYPASRALALEPARGHVLRNPPFPELKAYDQAFDGGLGPFQDFVQWFRLEEDIENQARARGEQAASPLLDAVRKAVERFMSALPGGRFSNLRAERGAAGDRAFTRLDRASLVIDKAGQRLALEQLSDGERTLLLLVADLARRLAIANPVQPDPLSGPGVVLIDEIELHLHPSWQRAVLPALKRVFSGLQIIATTHSPQVLSRVPAPSVILLDGFQVAGAVPPTFGRDTNAILEEVMSTPARPEEMSARLLEVSRLIDGGLLREARVALDQVRSRLGASDAEVVRLGTLIDFLEADPADSER